MLLVLMQLLLLMILLELIFTEHHNSSILLLITRWYIFSQIRRLHDILCLSCLVLDGLTLFNCICWFFYFFLLRWTLCFLCLLLWFYLLLNIFENEFLNIRIFWVECHLLRIVIEIDIDVDISMVYQYGLVFILFVANAFDLRWVRAVAVLRVEVWFVMVGLAPLLGIVYWFYVAWFVSKGDELH